MMLKVGMLLVAVTATVIPIDKLSLPERLANAPATTVVQVGPRTATLAQLRAAHARARRCVRACGGSRTRRRRATRTIIGDRAAIAVRVGTH